MTTFSAMPAVRLLVVSIARLVSLYRLTGPWRLQFSSYARIVVLSLAIPEQVVCHHVEGFWMTVYFQCVGDATVTATTVDCPAGIESLDSSQLATTFTLANWETIAGLLIAMWAIIFVCSQAKRLIETI